MEVAEEQPHRMNRLVCNHHFDHRDDGQNKDDGENNTADDVWRCRAAPKIPDVIF